MVTVSGRASKEIERIASAIDEAPFEPETWRDVLRAFASLTGSSRSELIGVELSRGLVSFDWISDDGDALRERARALGAYDRSINFRLAANLVAPDMAIVDERHYDAMRPQLANDIYLDFIEETRIPLGCQTSLLTTPDRFVGLAMLRTRADGRSTEEQRAYFAALAPHVRAAVKLQMAMEKHTGQAMLGAFDSVAAKALLTDSAGHVLAVTQAADRQLVDSGRISLVQGRIETPIAVETRRIAQAIQAVASRASAEATILLPPLRSEQHALRLEIYAAPEQRWSVGGVPATIIILHDGSVRTHERRALLMEHHALTAAEADIALALVRGASRHEVAAQRQASLETVRTQMKTLYHKLDVRREAELITRIVHLLGGA
jgi:DNA-binding CsgD family transcriptional regulator